MAGQTILSSNAMLLTANAWGISLHRGLAVTCSSANSTAQKGCDIITTSSVHCRRLALLVSPWSTSAQAKCFSHMPVSLLKHMSCTRACCSTPSAGVIEAPSPGGPDGLCAELGLSALPW